ncbi:hypothetical protein [Rubrivirga sp.]|uniref:hypothetical protein n=1 Tax=Rubrivirga sp. TaxID=1885344 RepID=UPI003C755D5A
MSVKQKFMDHLIRYRDPAAQAAFAPHLRPGETLETWAYGQKMPSQVVMFLLGWLVQKLLTKEYLMGLTDQRVILLRVKGKKANVLEVTEYDLGTVHPASIEIVRGFGEVTIGEGDRPFEAKFNPVEAPDNLEHAQEIIAALRSPVPA